MTRGWFDGSAEPADADEELVSSYSLRVGAKELKLDAGETLIGRGDACRVVINEAMVSRRHARIVMDGGRPYIEDLGSGNGTYVNQSQLHGRVELLPGDRIFIGTYEIEVLCRVDSEDRPTIPVFEEDLERRTPPSGVSAFDHMSSGRVTQPRRPASEDRSRGPDSKGEFEEFEAIGHLADKMFTMGRVDAATKILSGPLEGYLADARLGRVPGSLLLDGIGRYAVKLATNTGDGKWIDLAIETHLIAVRPLREETIQQLAALRARSPFGSDELIARYYERLSGSMAGFSAAERILSERVACLLPAL